jgi:putative endonuclease (uncharacterized protein DUF1780)
VTKSEHEYLEKLRAHASHAVEYLGNRHKPERERAVCRALLRCLGVSFADEEIVASTIEPVDVEFRDARFQVRDRLVPGTRRHAEWKARLAQATEARSMDDAIAPWPGEPNWTGETTPMTLTELTAAVTEALEQKLTRYGGQAGCAGLDALVYADLTWTHRLLLDSEPGNPSRLLEQGWRSVAVLFPPIGIVLCASEAAPSFLRQIVGTALHQWGDPDIFET